MSDGPYYVTDDGRVLSYRICSPTEIKLEDGRVLVDDKDAGWNLFATLSSAEKFAKLVRIEPGTARSRFNEWVRGKK